VTHDCGELLGHVGGGVCVVLGMCKGDGCLCCVRCDAMRRKAMMRMDVRWGRSKKKTRI
jgi:hypothetical protein